MEHKGCVTMYPMTPATGARGSYKPNAKESNHFTLTLTGLFLKQ